VNISKQNADIQKRDASLVDGKISILIANFPPDILTRSSNNLHIRPQSYGSETHPFSASSVASAPTIVHQTDLSTLTLGSSNSNSLVNLPIQIFHQRQRRLRPHPSTSLFLFLGIETFCDTAFAASNKKRIYQLNCDLTILQAKVFEKTDCTPLSAKICILHHEESVSTSSIHSA
jgi:hypothetical protein